MKLGYIPPMTKGLTLDRDYVIRLVEMLESHHAGADMYLETELAQS